MTQPFTLTFKDDPWYETVDITNFKFTVGKKLFIKFTAPGKPSDINVEPWLELKELVPTIDEIGKDLFEITYVIEKKDGSDIGNAIQKVHIGIKSNDKAPLFSTFKDSFAAASDKAPDVNGEVNIDCAAVPKGFETAQLGLVMTRGEQPPKTFPLEFGQHKPQSLPAGTYRVSTSPPELNVNNGTLRATVNVDPQTITVQQGKETTLKVTFGEVTKSSAIAFTLNLDGIPELIAEKLHVRYFEDGQEKKSFLMHSGQTQLLEKLPVKGKFAFKIDALKLNNGIYSFKDISGELEGSYLEEECTKEDVTYHADESKNALKLTISVSPEKKGIEKAITLRLIDAKTQRQYRFDNIPLKDVWGKVQEELIVPGTYDVEPKAFIYENTIYYIDVANSDAPVADNQFVVSAGKPAALLPIRITEGANLKVKGFPEFLSFGGCANMSPDNVDDFVAARVSSLFKYAGDDGAGDATHPLEEAKEPTLRVIKMAHEVSAKLKESVLPVMISYTCNLSLGNVDALIIDEASHVNSFANFIQALCMAESKHDEQHPVPAGFIVNPDFLGECQKSGFNSDKKIPVKQSLINAFKVLKNPKDEKTNQSVKMSPLVNYLPEDITPHLPEFITDTLKGYVQAVNWLARLIAPHVVLGWQLNLWGVGSAEWVYKDVKRTDVFNAQSNSREEIMLNPQAVGKSMAGYANALGIFDTLKFKDLDGNEHTVKGCDFMAVDRYEADDFTIRSYQNGYCYSPYEWERFFAFCASLSKQLRQPVMPWQIPASHLATVHDAVADAFDDQHWGSGGSYLLGHPEIGKSIDAINKHLLDLKFPTNYHDTLGADAHELFARHEWDLSAPKYYDFPLRGIFHVQLGGGATTGVVSAVGDASSFVRKKLHAYRDNPVKFDDSTDKD